MIDLGREGYQPFVAEWETGNISSSHRAVNKMALGLLTGRISGGVLVLPARKLYRYLTDRIGNYEELRPYFPMWSALPVADGYLGILAVEYDAASISRCQGLRRARTAGPWFRAAAAAPRG
jgi:hypothetical protein